MEHAIRVRVAVCLESEAGLLLVEHVKDDHRYWLLPGGGVEPGETVRDAARREVEEECGLRVEPGALLLLCETIDPAGGRHILHLVFSGRVVGGSLRPGIDGRLCDVGWHRRADIAALSLRPPIAAALLDSWDHGFAGPTRSLGNVWQPLPAG